MSKKLVAYFSASGTTANVAKHLAKAADADLYEIRPAVPYTRSDLNWMDRMKRVEPQLVYSGIFPPAHRQNPREYDSIHCGFSLIRQKSTRYKLLRTENEIVFMDFSVQRRSNPDGLRSTISR